VTALSIDVTIIITDKDDINKTTKVSTTWENATSTKISTQKWTALPTGPWDSTEQIMQILHKTGATFRGIRFAYKVNRSTQTSKQTNKHTHTLFTWVMIADHVTLLAPIWLVYIFLLSRWYCITKQKSSQWHLATHINSPLQCYGTFGMGDVPCQEAVCNTCTCMSSTWSCILQAVWSKRKLRVPLTLSN
jgi:hypothetical protein